MKRDKRSNKWGVRWNVNGRMVASETRPNSWDIRVYITVVREVPIMIEGTNIIIYRQTWEIAFTVPPGMCIMMLENRKK